MILSRIRGGVGRSGGVMAVCCAARMCVRFATSDGRRESAILKIFDDVFYIVLCVRVNRS